MRHLGPLLRKELRAYYYSPMAYVTAGVFLGLMGYFFFSSMQLFSMQSLSAAGRDAVGFNPTNGVIKGIFRSIGTVFTLLTPLITMRLIAEERRARTMELLLTSPLSAGTILAGKFLAALVMYAAMVLPTLYMPLIVEYLSSVSWGQIASGYAGLMLLGAAMISIGLFCSTVTDKQMIAAVLSIGILVLLWFIGGGIGGHTESVSRTLRDLSLFGHFENLYSGLFDLRDVVYLCSISAIFLFLSYGVLESDRWR